METVIKSFYIICEGQPLFVQSPQTIEEVQSLLSGFLSAFQTFATNLDKSKINKIEMDSSTFFYSVNKPLLSVIEGIPKDNLEAKVYQITAERLGRVFLDKYGREKITQWCGDLGSFSDFKHDYENITTEINQMLKKTHKEFITEYFVEAASDDNVIGAVVFDLEEDKILASDIPSEFDVKDFESFGSMLFSFIKRLGIQLKTGAINELILRAKNYWIGGFRKNELAVFMIFTQEYFGSILPDFVKRFIEENNK